MVVAAFDIDDETAHRNKIPSTNAWWDLEKAKIGRLREEHPGTVAARSRGGYRIIGVPIEPVILADLSDEELWRVKYLQWVAYLARRFAIICDTSCRDWWQLFRCPRSTRDRGGQAEDLEFIGEPDSVGIWNPKITAEDIAMAGQLRGKRAARPAAAAVIRASRGIDAPREPSENDAQDSLLGRCFLAMGWLGERLPSGARIARCPWSDQHGDGRGGGNDSSCVIFPANTKSQLGYLVCLHEHCRGKRTLGDVLRCIPAPIRTQTKFEISMRRRGIA
jgi:transposase-like protein